MATYSFPIKKHFMKEMRKNKNVEVELSDTEYRNGKSADGKYTNTLAIRAPGLDESDQALWVSHFKFSIQNVWAIVLCIFSTLNLLSQNPSSINNLGIGDFTTGVGLSPNSTAYTAAVVPNFTIYAGCLSGYTPFNPTLSTTTSTLAIRKYPYVGIPVASQTASMSTIGTPGTNSLPFLDNTQTFTGWRFPWSKALADTGLYVLQQYAGAINSPNAQAYFVVAVIASTCMITTPTVASSQPANTVICQGGGMTFTANSLGGYASLFTWSVNGTQQQALNPTQTNTSSLSYTFNTAGTYTISVLARNCSGGSQRSVVPSASPVNFIVTVNPKPTISATNPTVCSGQSAILTATSSGIVSWNSATLTPPLTATGNQQVYGGYIATATQNGCSNSYTVSIFVNPNPTISVNSATTCFGTTISLVPTGAISYSWNTPFTATSTSGYTVIGASAQGCTTSAMGTITVFSLPSISYSGTSVCAGEVATLQASGAPTLIWSSGSTVSPLSNTNYTVIGISAQGCSNTAVVTVTVNQLPIITGTTSSATLCIGSTATLTASGANSYTWSGLGANQVVTVSPTASSIYTVIGVDVNGCVNTTTVYQAVITCTSIDVGLIENTRIRTYIYPNPTAGKFNLSFPGEGRVQIIDHSGRIVFSEKFTRDIHVSTTFPPGLYTVLVTSDDKIDFTKLIISD